jgi:5-methylcytosine-specific restriction protein A
MVATGKGLGNVSEMDRSVWAELGSDHKTAKERANWIRVGIGLFESLQVGHDGDENEEFFEGRVLTEVHNRRERNPKLRKLLLALRRRTRRLACDMCHGSPTCGDPRFEDAAFEAHHLLPVSMAMERKTRLSDMALLCANCHRLLHRAISIEKRWLGIDEGRQIVGLLEDRSAQALRDRD